MGQKLLRVVPGVVCRTSNSALPHTTGESDQNAFIERYNRTYRTEVLNAYVFESLEQVRETSAEWLQSEDEERPHDAFASVSPAMYRV